MSCFVISNLVVTAGMLTPNLKVNSLFPLPSFPSRMTFHPPSSRRPFKLTSLPHFADKRHTSLANNKSISKRCYQRLQCQQILSPLHLSTPTLLPPRRLRLLQRRPGPECSSPAAERNKSWREIGANSTRPLRSSGQRRGTERLSNEKRGDESRH